MMPGQAMRVVLRRAMWIDMDLHSCQARLCVKERMPHLLGDIMALADTQILIDLNAHIGLQSTS